MFGPFGGENLSGQQDLILLSRESLIQAFLAVRDASLHGVSQSDIIQLTNDLNRALELQSQANANGSIALSSQVSSKATILQNEAMLQSIRLEILVYSTTFWAALLSALIVLEAHRITGWWRTQQRLRIRLSSGERADAA